MRKPRSLALAAASFIAAGLTVLPATPAPAFPCTWKGPFRASFDARWKTGLSLDTDQAILGVDIVDYQIQWSSGAWSEVYTPGQNDIDWVDPNRRVWSYFFDHTYMYVSCP